MIKRDLSVIAILNVPMLAFEIIDAIERMTETLCLIGFIWAIFDARLAFVRWYHALAYDVS